MYTMYEVCCLSNDICMWSTQNLSIKLFSFFSFQNTLANEIIYTQVIDSVSLQANERLPVSQVLVFIQ